MAMPPYDIVALSGKGIGYLVYLLIGMAFGAVLEMSGFGDSRKLSGQFYLRDMTVLKVMFTGIITAMLLIFGASALGLIDFEKVWVNHTFLWPQIIGGLVMGVGFIIGGFCPGTSLVAASTLKIDGAMFVGGVFFGVFLFGETFGIMEPFYNAGDFGRFTLYELFGVSAGLVVFLVVVIALVMFTGAEVSERVFGRNVAWRRIDLNPTKLLNPVFIGVFMFAALAVLIIPQPTLEDRWRFLSAEERAAFDRRDVFIHAGELNAVMNDTMLYTTILDIRSEQDFNLFHLRNAKRISRADLYPDAGLVKKLQGAPGNMVIVLMSNEEAAAAEAYRLLRVQGVPNLYMLAGGVNAWLDAFGVDRAIARKIDPKAVLPADSLHYRFTRAVGAGIPAADPAFIMGNTCPVLTFDKKVKIVKKAAKTGGCG